MSTLQTLGWAAICLHPSIIYLTVPPSTTFTLTSPSPIYSSIHPFSVPFLLHLCNTAHHRSSVLHPSILPRLSGVVHFPDVCSKYIVSVCFQSSINTSIFSCLFLSRLLQILDQSHYLYHIQYACRSQSRTRRGQEPFSVTVMKRHWADSAAAGAIQIQTVQHKCNHSYTWLSPLCKHKTGQIICTYIYTQKNFSLSVSTPQNWTHYPH